jgi:hypothetical protein
MSPSRGLEIRCSAIVFHNESPSQFRLGDHVLWVRTLRPCSSVDYIEASVIGLSQKSIVIRETRTERETRVSPNRLIKIVGG